MYDRILIDYFSFTSTIHSFESVLKLLGLNDVDGLTWVIGAGAHGYTTRYYFMGISIFEGSKQNNGIWVEMSGAGCRAFDTFSRCDWSVLFYEIVSGGKEYHLTRFDLAYDDWSGLLDIAEIGRATKAQEYISSMRWWECVFSSVGSSVYLGSPQSDVRFRIYDKAAETGRTEEISHWVRFEIQLRNNNAFAALRLIDTENVGDVFSGILKNYIRYVKPSSTETNKSRWAVRRWWSRFIGEAAAVKLWTPSDIDYNLYRCKRYVYKQAGNSIAALIEIEGLENFIEELRREKSATSAKYIELVNNCKLIKGEIVNVE